LCKVALSCLWAPGQQGFWWPDEQSKPHKQSNAGFYLFHVVGEPLNSL